MLSKSSVTSERDVCSVPRHFACFAHLRSGQCEQIALPKALIEEKALHIIQFLAECGGHSSAHRRVGSVYRTTVPPQSTTHPVSLITSI